MWGVSSPLLCLVAVVAAFSWVQIRERRTVGAVCAGCGVAMHGFIVATVVGQCALLVCWVWLLGWLPALALALAMVAGGCLGAGMDYFFGGLNVALAGFATIPICAFSIARMVFG